MKCKNLEFNTLLHVLLEKVMRVYVHYYKDDATGIEYRWRTLLQIGESWDICGTVIMKNPGSSKPMNIIDGEVYPIDDIELLKRLQAFENGNSYSGYDWYQFSVDNTMGHVGRLIGDYLRAHNKPVDGVIQIFNLFNIRDVDLNMALEKMKSSQSDNILMTTSDDIKHLVSPVYLGWGNLRNNQYFKDNAKLFFEEAKKRVMYLDPDYKNNSFYHPQYLLVYGRNKDRCKHVYSSFISD